jgi:(p)ppGpp synthase/HD superfamily hydrolase
MPECGDGRQQSETSQRRNDMVCLEEKEGSSKESGKKNSIFFARALERAVEVHRKQLDKAGAPYLLHPLVVMLKMDTFEEKIVALIHDVVEDSPKEKPVTLDDLRKDGFSEKVVKAVDCLTKRDEDKNRENNERLYLKKIKGNKLARKVKLADLEDNMDLTRLKEFTVRDMNRLNKYKKAFAYLNDQMKWNETNPSPRRRK